MNNYKEIYTAKSTNGRWGISVVTAAEIKQHKVDPYEIKPEPVYEGSVRSLGEVAGVHTYLYTPGETGAFMYIGGEVKIHGGATLVREISLQSSNYVTILLMGREAVIEEYGYKGRSSRIKAYVDGVRKDIPAPILLAMGLIKPAEPPAPPILQPPPLEGVMASAFATLRNK